MPPGGAPFGSGSVSVYSTRASSFAGEPPALGPAALGLSTAGVWLGVAQPVPPRSADAVIAARTAAVRWRGRRYRSDTFSPQPSSRGRLQRQPDRAPM